MKFVRKVEIKRNFYIAGSRIRGEYLIRVNGGSTEKIDQMDNPWSCIVQCTRVIYPRKRVRAGKLPVRAGNLPGGGG